MKCDIPFDDQFFINIFSRKAMEVVAFGFIFQLCYAGIYAIKWDLFSTKTLYEWSHDVHAPLGDNGEMLTSYNNRLCNAVHVNAIIRHGARNPSEKNINKMNPLRDKIVADKPGGIAMYIDTWKNLYNIKEEKQLVEKGIKEQFNLGKRFGRKFFRLLDSARDDDIKFVSSSKKRAIDSSEYFYGGLQEIFSKLDSFENEVKDELMRFYDHCGNYEKFVEGNKTNFREFDDFHKTEEFINVAKDIRKNLSLNISLEQDEIYLLYEMCAYEKYIFNSSVWCTLMTDADRQVLEYGQDLEKFYESSYGHPLNSKLSCKLVDKIFDTMDEVIDHIKDKDNHTAAVFQFGHSETVVQLFTALGLFKDPEPLLATNMQKMVNRQFKTSQISPYSANIAFVLYACEELRQAGNNDRDIKEFVLKILVNEKPVIIPACNQEQCLYSVVKEFYHDLTEHCDRDEICGDHDHHDDDDHDDDDGRNNSWKLTWSLYILFSMITISFGLQKA